MIIAPRVGANQCLRRRPCNLYNDRRSNDGERVTELVMSAEGKRLTYEEALRLPG